MPGRGSYGPAGKWIHDRAHRIMESSPETPKSVAYATATQQAHKVGKSPKKFRTAQGVREAKAKFSLPKKEYQKTAMVIPFPATKGVGIAAGVGLGVLGTGLTVKLLKDRKKRKRFQGAYDKARSGGAKHHEAIRAGKAAVQKTASADIGSVDELLEKISARKRKHRQPKYKQRGRGPLQASIEERGGVRRGVASLPTKEELLKKIETEKPDKPGAYVTKVLKKHQMDPGRVKPLREPKPTSARQQARELGIEQPMTLRQRLRGVKERKKKAPPPGPRVEHGRLRDVVGGRRSGAPSGGAPRPQPAAAARQVSKLKRFGVPAAVIGGLGLAAGAGAYALHRRKKKLEKEIKQYFGKKKTAGVMMGAFVDELVKISQDWTASARMQASQRGAESVQNLVQSGGASPGSESQGPGLETKTAPKSTGLIDTASMAPKPAPPPPPPTESLKTNVAPNLLGSSAAAPGATGQAQLGRGFAQPSASEFGG